MTSLDKFVNYENTEMFSRFSPLITNGLTLLILVESANYLGTLFPKSIRLLFRDNNFFKHFIALMSCIVYCVVHKDEIINVSEQVLTGILIYIIFVLFTKVEKTLFLIIIGFLFILFIIQLYKQYNLYPIHMHYINQIYNKEFDGEEVDTDIELSGKIGKIEVDRYNTISYVQMGSLIVVILLCIIGFISKLMKKWPKNKHMYQMKYGYILFLYDFIFTNLHNRENEHK
jgi:hypothetical protein